MGRELVKQDNGLYTLWSYICDSPIGWDFTREEYIEYKVQCAIEVAKEEAEQTLNWADKQGEFDSKMKGKTVYNMTKEDFAKFLVDIKSKLTVNDFYFPAEDRKED